MNFTDDYKRIEFYERHSKGVRDGFNSFTVKGEHFFTLHIRSKIYLISESYSSKRSRDNGIASVRKNIKKKERYKLSIPRAGRYFFFLIAGNNQSIAKSNSFGTEIARHKAVQTLREFSLSSGASSAKSTKKKSTVSSKDTSAVKKKSTASSTATKSVAAKGNYHSTAVTYKIFKSTNDKYYFTFRDKDDNAIVMNNNVRGYVSLDAAKKGLAQVLDHGPSKSNYEIKETKNGKYYFFVKNDKDKNVGKSFFYATKKECNAAIALLVGAKGAGKASATKKAATKSATLNKSGIAKSNTKKTSGSSVANKGADKGASKGSAKNDYLPVKRYSGKAGFHTFETKDGTPYFGYNSRTGTYLRSEGYSSSSARLNGVKSVIKNSKNEKRWGTEKKGAKWYFYLKAGNGQEIGRSGGYESEAAMNRGLSAAKNNLSGVTEDSASVLSLAAATGAAGTKKSKATSTSPSKAKSTAASSKSSSSTAASSSKVSDKSKGTKSSSGSTSSAKSGEKSTDAKSAKSNASGAGAKSAAKSGSASKSTSTNVSGTASKAGSGSEKKTAATSGMKAVSGTKSTTKATTESASSSSGSGTSKSGLSKSTAKGSDKGSTGSSNKKKGTSASSGSKMDSKAADTRSKDSLSISDDSSKKESASKGTSAKKESTSKETSSKNVGSGSSTSGSTSSSGSSSGSSSSSLSTSGSSSASNSKAADSKSDLKSNNVKSSADSSKKVSSTSSTSSTDKKIIQSERSGCSAWWLLLLLIPIIFLLLWKGCGIGAGDTASTVKPAAEKVQSKAKSATEAAAERAEAARKATAEKARLAKEAAQKRAAAAAQAAKNKVNEASASTSSAVKKTVENAKKVVIPAAGAKSTNDAAASSAAAPNQPVAGQTRLSIASVIEGCIRDNECYAPKYYKWGGTRFAKNSASINGAAFTSLAGVAGVLKRFPNTRLEIQGHLSNDESNSNISQARAKAVYDFLVRNGVSSSQLNYTGKANSAPIKTGTSEQANYQNRRVEFVITSK